MSFATPRCEADRLMALGRRDPAEAVTGLRLTTGVQERGFEALLRSSRGTR